MIFDQTLYSMSLLFGQRKYNESIIFVKSLCMNDSKVSLSLSYAAVNVSGKYGVPFCFIRGEFALAVIKKVGSFQLLFHDFMILLYHGRMAQW